MQEALGVRLSRLASCVSGSVVGEHSQRTYEWSQEVAKAVHDEASKETLRRRAAKFREKKGQKPRSRDNLEAEEVVTTAPSKSKVLAPIATQLRVCLGSID